MRAQILHHGLHLLWDLFFGYRFWLFFLLGSSDLRFLFGRWFFFLLLSFWLGLRFGFFRLRHFTFQIGFSGFFVNNLLFKNVAEFCKGGLGGFFGLLLHNLSLSLLRAIMLIVVVVLKLLILILLLLLDIISKSLVCRLLLRVLLDVGIVIDLLFIVGRLKASLSILDIIIHFELL